MRWSATESDVRNAQGFIVVELKNGKLVYLSYQVYFEIVTPQGTVSMNYVKDIASIQYTE